MLSAIKNEHQPNIFLLYVCGMESEINTEEKENKGLYWLICLSALVVGVALLIFSPQWFWLALPFFLTYFVKAIGMM